MVIYDESLENIIENPDLEKGYLVYAEKFVAHHDEQKEQVDYEIMEGTITEENPKGLRRMIVKVPYRAAYDEYETVQKYVPYTEEELVQMQKEKEEAENAAKKAEEKAKLLAEEQAAKEQKIAKIDELEAQITYTAMMTDTLMTVEG